MHYGCTVCRLCLFSCVWICLLYLCMYVCMYATMHVCMNVCMRIRFDTCIVCTYRIAIGLNHFAWLASTQTRNVLRMTLRLDLYQNRVDNSFHPSTATPPSASSFSFRNFSRKQPICLAPARDAATSTHAATNTAFDRLLWWPLDGVPSSVSHRLVLSAFSRSPWNSGPDVRWVEPNFNLWLLYQGCRDPF